MNSTNSVTSIEESKRFFQSEAAKTKRQLEQTELELSEKNECYLQSKKVCQELIELQKKLCSNVRKSVTCKCCNRIFTEPIDLPCSNSICKKHLDDLTENKCFFCKQSHDTEIEEEEIILNESLSETITSDLYLNETERLLKTEIEQLFYETNNLFEKLKSKETEIELFFSEHFGKIMNKIDLQKEELTKIRRNSRQSNRPSESL